MDVTDVTGPMGKSQLKILLVMLLRPMPASFIAYSTLFSLIEEDHWCSPPAGFQNLTSMEWKNRYVPRTGPNQFSKCEYYGIDDSGNVTDRALYCDRWDYDKSGYYDSIRSDWNLVCHRGWYVSMLYIAPALGNIIAYIPSGHIADRYGRKTVSLVGSSLCAAFALASAFSTSWEMLFAFKFLIGICFGIYQNPMLCLFVEAVGPEYRSWINFSFSGAWGFFTLVVAGVSYYIKDWRHILYLGSFPLQLPVVFLLWWLVPETSRWLLSVRRYEKAEKQIIRMAKENGRTVDDPERMMEQLKLKVEMDKDKTGKHSFLDLMKDRQLMRVTLVLYLSFILTVFVNHGFHISVGQLGGSLHLNVLLSGLVEIVCLGLYFGLVRWTTRRRGLLICLLLGGVCFLLTIPIGEDLHWLRVTVAMVGLMFNSAAYSLLYVFAAELFPTNLRVAGVSGGMTAGRIGSLMASFTDDLGRIYGRSAPLAMYGIMSLMSSAFFLLLPETSHRHLPDTITETKLLASSKNPKASNMKMETLPTDVS